MTDWIDNILDQHPGESVPTDFGARVDSRIDDEGHLLEHHPRSWWPKAAAAALLLAFGFWLGKGRPDISTIQEGPATTAVSADEMAEMFQAQEVLESWEFVADDSLNLSLSDAAAGSWDPTQEE
ncbi:MAG TPA: hypothetical protein QGG59_06295 [Planctomycetota bacterium]|jgi:hypothetical protein|nr:hypothetical protein [Planctomycetota bacterium]MDP6128106.1 hypothetical protein [Planctomycetota bacterium]MDP7245752.1 hypothetical protein [Planctomycetota bacterium]MDP7560942.1 hypothetical protein [Planctomycetota bacterium]HJM39708.1 hypothetical protein [Planctomycetota bacterium]|tara:strand:- start:10997 stop:11368 length:372 start_codon:yes stop_codon:yes gene_type:complete